MIQPLGNRVLIEVKKEDEKKTASGIYIPEEEKAKDYLFGTVVSQGSKCTEELIGKDVYFSKGEKLGAASFIVEEEDVLAVQVD